MLTRVMRVVIVLQVLLAAWDLFRLNDVGMSLHILTAALLQCAVSLRTFERAAALRVQD